MPQSLDVAPSSSRPAEEGVLVSDPPPPEVAARLTSRHGSCQLPKWCSLKDEYFHDNREETHATLFKQSVSEPECDQDQLLFSLSDSAEPVFREGDELEVGVDSDVAPPARGLDESSSAATICVSTAEQQDASLITQAPRRAFKRKGEDRNESSQGCSRVSRRRFENDENTLLTISKVVQELTQDDTNAFLCFDEDTKLVPPFSVDDGLPMHREDSEWSISTDVCLEDSAARLPLGCLYSDDSYVAASSPPTVLMQELDAESSEDEEDEDVYTDFDPYRFMKYLPPLNLVVPDARDPVLPPKTSGCTKMTLVLDLDETLVHSSLDGGLASDFTFLVDFNNQQHSVNVKQRPCLYSFLERAAALFEVVIFTASQQVYAEQLLDILDPEGKLIQHRIYRDSCVYVDGNYLKDLTVLGRDLQRTVIVDNSPHAFGFQIGNGIPIESWYDDEEDRELQHLMPFLEKLSFVGDVRPLIADTYKVHQLVAKADEPGCLPVL